MELNKNILIRNGLALLNSGFLILKPLVIVYFVNNYFGNEAYGQLSLFLSSLSAMSLLTSFGTNISMRRFLPTEEDLLTKRRLFYRPIFFQLGALSILSAFLFLSLPLIFNELKIYQVFIFVFYYFSFVLFNYFLEYRRFTNDIYNYTKYSLTFSAIYVSSLIGLLFTNSISEIFQILILESSAMFIMFIFLFTGIIKQVGFGLEFFRKDKLKTEIKKGLPQNISELSEIIIVSADRYIVAALLTIAEAGIYVTSYFLGSVPLLLIRVMGLVMPQLMFLERDKGSDKGVENILDIEIFVFCFLSIPYLMVVIFAGNEILEFFNIFSFQAHLSLIVISLATIFYGIYSILSVVALMELKTLNLMKMVIWFGFFNIILSLILIYITENFVSVAFSTLFTYVGLSCYFYLKMSSLWDYNIKFKSLSLLVCLALLSIMVSLLSAEYLNIPGLSKNHITLIVFFVLYSSFSSIYLYSQKVIKFVI